MLDGLFWFTGLLVWTLIALAILGITLLVLYEMTGVTIFWVRVLRAGKRAQIKTTGLDTLRLWYYIFWTYKRGSWTIKNTGEKIRWPRPWYNSEDDKEWLPRLNTEIAMNAEKRRETIYFLEAAERECVNAAYEIHQILERLKKQDTVQQDGIHDINGALDNARTLTEKAYQNI